MKVAVKDWMSKNPLRIDVNESMETARDILNQEKIRHLLVTFKGNLEGVLTTQDLEKAETLRSKFKGLDCLNVKITAGDLMSRLPVSVPETTNMSEAIRAMEEKKIHSLPIKNMEGRVTGILTSTDIMRYAIASSKMGQFSNSWDILS